MPTSDRIVASPVSRLTLSTVLQTGLPMHAREHRLPLHHWNVLRAITACHTPSMGGHLYQCQKCGRQHFVPHSCRNRHCPSCQGLRGRDWVDEQSALLLPIPYFHLVFTLPHDLNRIIQQNRTSLYDLLFDSVSDTLQEFARNDLKVQIGITSVLHTWSQTLVDHYHLHCIVTGGGMRLDGQGWQKTTRHWLFPVRALSKVFRAKFRDGLRELFTSGKLEFHGELHSLSEKQQFKDLLKKAVSKDWVVYAKRPFAGPKSVLAYLARYTHRVGITNNRLLTLDITAQTVTFSYKDYADHSRHKTMTLGLSEFIRRFRLHILPERFVKIRHYGLLTNRHRHTRIAQAHDAILKEVPADTPPIETTVKSQQRPRAPQPTCPFCHHTGLVLMRVTYPIKHRPDTS